MPRLPVPGSDDGQWGEILNAFLRVEHNDDGSLKVPSVPLSDKGIAGGVAELDGGGKVPTSQLPASVFAGDASPTQKGVIQLAGDLDNTASVPRIANGAITDAKVASNAGIAQSKIANLTTDLADKEPLIAAGATNEYWRGDKTWQTLNKNSVGLSNVDNTSDANKPVSTATQTALDLKENLSNKSTSTILGTSDTLYPTQNAVKTYVDTAGGNYLPLAGGTMTGGLVLPSNGLVVNTSDFVIGTNSGNSNPAIGIGTATPDSNSGLRTVLHLADTTSNGAEIRLNSPAVAARIFNSNNDFGFGTDTNHTVRFFVNGGANTMLSLTASGAAIPVNNAALSTGDNTNVSSYINLQGSRAFVGYSSSNNLLLQGGGTKGIQFSVNNGTFGSGVVASIDTSGNWGFLASNNTPTHTLTLGSTSSGIALYNTADQTTNFERVRHYWSSNTYTIATTAGGTGTARAIRIDAAATSISLGAGTVGTGSSNVAIQRDATSTITMLEIYSSSLQASGSVQRGILIDPVINQSATAGYTMLYVNPTETSTGSGAKLLADFAVGGTSKFKIDNTGKTTINNDGESIALGTGLNVTNYISFEGTRAFVGTYNGGHTVLQGGSGKGIKLLVNNSGFGAGSGMTIDTSANTTFDGFVSASNYVQATNAMYIDNTVASNYPGYVVRANTDTGAAYNFYYRKRTSGAVQNNDSLGFFGFRTHDGTSYVNQDSARISSIATQTTSTTHGGALIFGTAANGTAISSGASERMRIDQSGYIRIGSSATIAAKLTFDAGTTAADGILFGADTTLYRSAADTLTTDDTFSINNKILLSSTGNIALADNTNGYIQLVELSSAPSTPASNNARLFLQDDGSGNSQLAIKYDSGTTQVLGSNSYSNGLQLPDTSGASNKGITFGSDTNLYRSAADTLKTDDKLLVGGGITPRVTNLSVSANTYVPNCDTTDVAIISSPSAAFTVDNPSGTAQDGQELTIRISSGGTGYAPTWGTNYLASGMTTLPTTALPASKTVTLKFTYYASPGKWVLLAADTVGI